MLFCKGIKFETLLEELDGAEDMLASGCRKFWKLWRLEPSGDGLMLARVAQMRCRRSAALVI